ncbi:hypothetical protein BDV37DRAFT_30340 [Aspergillus pseudonomiae]|uniref:Uncharacterized protein n=1 Tax=Aspergillus pseudonomiae TaxID=1506151 RepID=A0A5N7DLU2_9EURO|nr:uncharacterized protein BDV37DRAFT_30340 [Aspergillus pseudonomiae]KAE8407275.1 hypothetical protein BDV37DRAFT_30340 [Aspergillus pseudonomiae]
MASPQQPAPPRHSRGFSFGGRSDKSSNSGSNKIRLTESAEEKHKRTLHTKADPMVAMSEAQPTDPDLSNPTRPRLERPLDTIRSFEAAIYGSYNSRPVSYARTDHESTPGAEYSRRSSYYGGHNGHHRGYNDQNGYYNGRGTYSRPESYMESNYGGGPPPENHYPYNQGGGRRPRRHRMEPEYHGAQNGYGSNGYHKSYENVTAASGSGSNTDPWANNSTDPSSVNSSIDQLQLQQQQQQQQLLQQQQQERAVAERYGFAGFGPEPNLSNGGALASGAAGTGPIKLGNSAPVADPTAGGPVGGPASAAGAPTTRRHLRKATNASDASDTKRKSWFKRRFSKD